MTTERLQEFVVLASLLNFTRAADTLYITQSVLSRHIKEIEDELGVTLFVRSTHGVALTNEGRYFLREVRPIIKKANDSISLLQSQRLQADGVVRVTCSEQCLNTRVLGFLSAFHNQYEDISLSIKPVTGSSSLHLLPQTELLISPCDLPDLTDDIASHTLLTSQSAHIAIPPRHPLGRRQSASLTEIYDETLLVPFADEPFGPYARNALLAERMTHGHIEKIAMPDAPTALLMTEMGLGLTIIPHHLKRHLYPHTRSVAVENEECRFPIICYLNLREASPAAEFFYESIVKYFRS